MSIKTFHKVTALPGTLTPDSMYLVRNNASGYVETYVTSTSGVASAVGNSAMINALIDAKLSDWNTIDTVTDIAARDLAAQSYTRNTLVLVSNATDDPTVEIGAAMYVYKEASDSFEKVYEFGGLDFNITWASIVGRPNSSPAQIDAAVAASHTHANKSTLDKINESNGEITFNGASIGTTGNTDW